jgi:uncharacterized membrane protein YtjA (UPF0391 family)
MLRLALLFCVLSTGALLVGHEGVATNAAMAAAALFSLTGVLFAVIALGGALTRRVDLWFPDPD